ncbi:hypothetical protein D3C81_1158170 [compost metagenome]
MNSGSSASIGSAGQSASTWPSASWYQWSRPANQSMPAWVWATTSTLATFGQSCRAWSTLALRAMCLPPRRLSSAVITRRQSASRMRSRRASGAKPPNTTECTAPMRAQASMAQAASGIIGR